MSGPQGSLRDARLRKALDNAPDAQLLPSDSTRRAILASAHAAGAPASWWRCLWAGSSRQRMSWNAAFATLAIASVVTLLWHDREVPDARTDADRVSMQQAPAPAPTPDASRASGQAPAAAPAPMAPAARAPQPSKPRLSEPEPDKPQAQPAAPESARERRAERAPLRDDARGAATQNSAPQAEASDAAGLAAAKSAAPAPAPPRPAPAMARSAPPPARMSMPPADAVTEATHLRVTAQGRTVDAAWERSSALSGLIASVVRDARGGEAPDAPIDTCIELRQGGVVLGVLELSGPRARWTPAGAPASSGVVDAGLMQALRDELAQLPR